MKFKFLLFLTSLILLSSCSNDEYVEVPIKQRPINTLTEWYPEGGDPSDSLLVPIIADVSLNIENIQGLKTNIDEYRLDGVLTIMLPIASPYIDFEKDTIFKPSEFSYETAFIYDESDTYYEELFSGPFSSDEEMMEIFGSDSIYEVSDRFSMKLFHDWDLKKYPFDRQKLKFSVTSFNDTSLIRFRHGKYINSGFDTNLDLKKGFKLESIEFKEDIVDRFFGDVYDGYYSRGTFELTISRSGSWVFVKLFFGGILALVLSWLVFIIPTRDFASRIELSIGAVFAAVGNKYFVDSAIDSQLLTVADLFNNIIIFMVVLNVGLIIMKRNAVFKNKLINDTRTVSRISIYTALVLFGLLTIYTIT